MSEASELREREEQFVRTCVEALGDDDLEDFDMADYLPPPLVNGEEYPVTEQQWRNDHLEGHNPYNNYLGEPEKSDWMWKFQANYEKNYEQKRRRTLSEDDSKN